MILFFPALMVRTPARAGLFLFPTQLQFFPATFPVLAHPLPAFSSMSPHFLATMHFLESASIIVCATCPSLVFGVALSPPESRRESRL